MNMPAHFNVVSLNFQLAQTYRQIYIWLYVRVFVLALARVFCQVQSCLCNVYRVLVPVGILCTLYVNACVSIQVHPGVCAEKNIMSFFFYFFFSLSLSSSSFSSLYFFSSFSSFLKGFSACSVGLCACVCMRAFISFLHVCGDPEMFVCTCERFKVTFFCSCKV